MFKKYKNTKIKKGYKIMEKIKAGLIFNNYTLVLGEIKNKK